jgi:aminoglycoside phosphotransferase (APT) family kinase protein
LICHQESINAEDAENIITATFPRFRGLRVALLDEGWDFRLFEVGDQWLFRFPKHETSVIKLNMERKLLSGLGEWVSLPVPIYEYYGRASLLSDQLFAGYRKLPGVPGDLAEVVDRPLVTRQLGLFLDTLHTYPLDTAKEAGVPEVRDMVAHWRNKALEGLKKIVDFEVTTYQLHHYLSKNAPSPFEGTPRLVHNDLWAEHVLIDSRSGGVVGIIDWGDTAIGDPAIDFAGLYTWHGESWLKRLLESYPGALDSELISRAHYLATCLAIHNVALGRALGRPEWIEAGENVIRWVLAE